ncbi:MAG: hypothetical protein K6B45_12100 [Bacteroidaceae bacterium]|nr:hypothetical protein [Bacteroidaceae bacterium]
MKKKTRKKPRAQLFQPQNTPRTERLITLFTKEEKQLVDRYLTKYHITNRSRWMRETLLRAILQNLEMDYPTLFDEHDMRR